MDESPRDKIFKMMKEDIETLLKNYIFVCGPDDDIELT